MLLVLMSGFVASLSWEVPAALPGEGDLGEVSALGSWPHRLDCMSVGGEWVREIPGPCPGSGPALTWC